MKKLLLVTIIPFMLSCQFNSKYNYSEIETKQFLDDITRNAKVVITDITEIKKEPTDELLIFTRYPLSKIQLEEYNRESHLINRDDDISDFATYRFLSYELINENGEKLEFIDNKRAIYLQETSLWEYDNVLFQKLVIEVKLNKKFQRLNGHISIEFEMPHKIKKEVKIPVDISIYDTITD